MDERELTRGERVIAFIEKYCRVPEGALVGEPIRLAPFQKDFILAVYDTGTGRRARRAILSIARKNGKTALIACLVLAHLVGPEAHQNASIVSGAMSREQASQVYNYAAKMATLSPMIAPLVRQTPSGKRLKGLPMNTEYHAMAAEAGTAHGGSPVVAILDELGQVKGPHSPFVEAIETSQGAYDEPLLIAISTQAPTDDDLFSRWIDDAIAIEDPLVVCHVYTAPEERDLLDEDGWAEANPGLGLFRSRAELQAWAERAERLPSDESTFRWLYLNQRVEANDPYVSPKVWANCADAPSREDGITWYGGLDLSSARDLTAYVRVGWYNDVLQVDPTFWLPGEGLRERAKADRVEYGVWHEQGYLSTCPGNTVDYGFVAPIILSDLRAGRVKEVAFDRWNWRFMRAELVREGATDQELERFTEFGQGFQSMSPALRILDTLLLNGRVAHGDHPVLNMCARNAVVKSDPAGNRKLVKLADKRRIDGMVALTMAASIAGDPRNDEETYVAANREFVIL